MEYEPIPAYVVMEADADGGKVVRIGGELDMACRDAVEPAVLDAIAQSESVIIDLSDLTFCDSSGIAVLLMARAKANTDAVPLTIRHAQSAVRRVLGLTGVDHVIDIRDDPAD